MRWIVLGLISLAVWHWAGLLAKDVSNARTVASPCALPLKEVQARMAYHGTLIAYCDKSGWKFPRGLKVCKLWAPNKKSKGGRI